jgi:hypothetical protein
MKSTVCSGVQAPAGFSRPVALGQAGEDEAGDQQMSADLAAFVLRNSCCRASVKTFTPALETL